MTIMDVTGKLEIEEPEALPVHHRPVLEKEGEFPV